jgi:hypothetical protein
MKKHFLFLVSCILLLNSCTSVIQVTVPNGSQLVVVDAFMDNSPNPQIVRLTFNANYFSNVSTPPVLGATVGLTDLTNAKTYSFTPDGNGNYIYTPGVNDSMAQLHHKYQLNISYNGNTYNAVSTLNRTMAIDTIAFEIATGPNYNLVPLSDTTKPRKFYPYVYAFDSTGPIHDYYWLKVFKNGVFYNQPQQLDIFEDGGYGHNYDSDSLNPQYTFNGLTSDDNPIYRNDVCMVQAYSINSNTFDFLTQMKSQMTNAQNGLFAVTPQNVKTNIQQTNGTLQAIGWFNIGEISSKSVIAK